MATFLLRVWLPDRPGALGAVASRIGSVRGDVIGIDILEQGGGRVIDELVVRLPDESLVPLLLNEVGNVDGVSVEDIRPASGGVRDHRLDALEAAAILVEETDLQALIGALARHAQHDFEADWVAVIDGDEGQTVFSVGTVPHHRWLAAFVVGSRSSSMVATGEAGPDDVATASLPGAGLTLVLGRRGRPFRVRERRQASALCRIVDARVRELLGRQSRAIHPSAQTLG